MLDLVLDFIPEQYHAEKVESSRLVDLLRNAVAIAELAVDKQAQTLLMPVSARQQLNDSPDEMWTRIGIEFYKDA